MIADAAESSPRASSDRTTERLWIAAIAAGALALFLSAYSSRVALADATESVSGVRALGILHAPGYPAYVVAARVAASIVPVGSWAARVNLFSVLCATATVVVLFQLARRFGASRAGAAIGAFAVGMGVSYWFYAAYAKHYAFSGLVVALAALLAMSWQQRGGPWRIVVAGALLGVGMGSSWQLSVIMLVGIAILVGFGDRRPRWAELLSAGAVFALVALAGFVFVLVRARQNPAVNWGEATSFGRFVNLFSLADFRVGDAPATGLDAFTHLPGRLLAYFVVLVREMGPIAFGLAVVGAVFVYLRHRRAESLFLLVVFVLNVVTVVFAAGLDHESGIDSGLIVGGFLIDTLFVLGILIAVGSTELIRVAREWFGAARGRSRAGPAATWVGPALTTVIVIVVLVPSLVVHFPYADHRGPPLADAYAAQVLDPLPPNAVLLVWGAEFGMPVTYRQIVLHKRSDVVVISGPEMLRDWYREQIGRQLDTTMPAFNGDLGQFVTGLIAQLRATRPVVLDMTALQQLSTRVGYETSGLVAEVADGGDIRIPKSLPALSTALERADRAGGVATTAHLVFPNHAVYFAHERAHIELAKMYALKNDRAGTVAELSRALALEPGHTAVRGVIELIEQQDPRAGEAVGQL